MVSPTGMGYLWYFPLLYLPSVWDICGISHSGISHWYGIFVVSPALVSPTGVGYLWYLPVADKISLDVSRRIMVQRSIIYV